jgi:hypothetical protein
MSAAQPGRITCEVCGRSGPYRPELAGKRIKCKCGNIMLVADPPAEEPLRPEPLPPDPSADQAADELSELYDLREDPNPAKPPRVFVAPDPSRLGYESRISPPPPPPAANPYPTYSKPKTADPQSEKSGLMRMLIVIGVLGAVIAGAIVGIKMMGGPHRPAGPQLGEDADIEQKIQDEYNKEIHAWFTEDPSRIMGPWSQSQALGQADRWQQMGAKRILAFGSRLSMVAVIELPDDPAKRKQLFDWQADWHGQHFEKVWKDVGQKYLMIRLGI